MHFAIPDTTEKLEGSGSAYTVFNLHINGAYHCSARYKQLLNFHEQLKKEFGARVPAFPPKKFLALSASELDERRLQLEKYVQTLSLIGEISSSSSFTNFLLLSQQENCGETMRDVELDVYLLNGHQITVLVSSRASTDSVLELVASKIELPANMIYYFGLFLVQNDDNSIAVIRRLDNFESPYISLKSACRRTACRIVLRKSFWDLELENDLLPNRVAMNLLFVQAACEVDNGWVQGSKDQLRQLDGLRQKGSKREYLRLARTLKFYGYLHFQPCVTDYPKPNCPTLVSIGNKELVMRIDMAPGDAKEFTFKVTRMRCWRITSMLLPSVSNGNGAHGNVKVGTNGFNNDGSSQNTELSFEYLVSRDTLRWFSIHSDQAIMMSICLQSVVDELMMKKDSRKPSSDAVTRSTSHDSTVSSSVRRSTSSESGAKTPSSPIDPQHSQATSPSHTAAAAARHSASKSESSVRRIQDILSPRNNTLSENSAFEQAIGDEDL